MLNFGIDYFDFLHTNDLAKYCNPDPTLQDCKEEGN